MNNLLVWSYKRILYWISSAWTDRSFLAFELRVHNGIDLVITHIMLSPESGVKRYSSSSFNSVNARIYGFSSNPGSQYRRSGYIKAPKETDWVVYGPARWEFGRFDAKTIEIVG